MEPINVPQPLAPLNILVVDDEPNIRKTLSYCLKAEKHAVVAVGNAADAASEGKRRSFDMAFVDLRLGAEDGMDLIPRLLSDSPWMKIVVITAYASVESAVEAMRRGAEDYIPKPFTPDQVRLLTRRIGRIRRLETEIAALKADQEGRSPAMRLNSANAAMRRVIDTARKAAAAEAIILLQGESGTGKSALARAIHQWSPRAARPMATVSCPSVPPDLLESELFGHVKGAFTGAVRDNPGRIALCEGGTLFLDEIGDLAPPVQAKLLRFIQDKEFERLGDPTLRRADVRLLAATNADLEKRVAEGRFREDLFYRLNVIPLTVPPLRERPEDIPPLAGAFLAHFNGTRPIPLLGFTTDGEAALKAHPWPGNVRELRNAVERAVILCGGDRIGAGDLPGRIGPDRINPDRAVPAIGDRVSLAEIEEQHIRRVIADTGSLQEAADVLGIDQATLWRRRKAYGL